MPAYHNVSLKATGIVNFYSPSARLLNLAAAVQTQKAGKGTAIVFLDILRNRVYMACVISLYLSAKCTIIIQLANDTMCGTYIYSRPDYQLVILVPTTRMIEQKNSQF